MLDVRIVFIWKVQKRTAKIAALLHLFEKSASVVMHYWMVCPTEGCSSKGVLKNFCRTLLLFL